MGAFLVVLGMAGQHHELGQPRPVLEDWHFDPLPIRVALPPNRYVSAKLRVFIESMVERMAADAPVAPANSRIVR
jgi:DNA-binding transcriptional LysR family regulator